MENDPSKLSRNQSKVQKGKIPTNKLLNHIKSVDPRLVEYIFRQTNLFKANFPIEKLNILIWLS